MGCNECKKKGYQDSGSTTIPLVPESIQNGNYSGHFLFKLVAFIVVILALPLLFTIVIGQLFLTFFLPKKTTDLTSMITIPVKGIATWYGKLKFKRQLRKREKQFRDTESYDTYDVVETEEYTPEEILEDAENLTWVNLSRPNPKKDSKDNNKK